MGGPHVPVPDRPTPGETGHARNNRTLESSVSQIREERSPNRRERLNTLFLAQAAISEVYVFDSGVLPFLHVPVSFPLVTLLYFASMGELWGLAKALRIARERLRPSK